MLSTGPSSTTWRTNGEPPSGSWSEDDVLGADVAELHEELIAVLAPATDCLAVPWTTSGSSRTTHQSACALLLSRSETGSGPGGTDSEPPRSRRCAGAAYTRNVAVGAVVGRAAVACYRMYVRMLSKGFSVLASGAFAEFGARSVLLLPVRLVGEERIAIGDDVYVGAGSWLQTLEGPGHEGKLVVGDGTNIAGSCVLSAAKSVRLGRKELLARDV